MTAEERRASIIARERARAGKPRPQRKPRVVDTGNWCVLRINDDGRTEVYRAGLSARAADELAGRRRDLSTEEEIGEGWNYLPRIRRGVAA